ncbi:unnamed protein product [Adineta steineri]|uniref:Uncharacterized protein n=1 Tax=Adineta steineri TaxID=433720 RepID=A0A814ZT27_9BILA|nr:unnamed protein product [Adineta steineri]
MDISSDISNTVEELINNNSNETSIGVPVNTLQETASSINEDRQNIATSNEPILIQISEINTNIIFPWKIQAYVTCEYPKKTFANTYGNGEVSNWDLTDQSGSITLVAFNVHSYIMTEKLKLNQAYEFKNLTIRASSDAYKTVAHPCQLICTTGTRVQEVDLSFNFQQISYNFIHLNQVDTIPLNSIIDIQVKIVHDFGITTGMKNENTWFRRNIIVDQDGVNFCMTLWNNLTRTIDRNMEGLRVKFKNVKVSWFDGM